MGAGYVAARQLTSVAKASSYGAQGMVSQIFGLAALGGAAMAPFAFASAKEQSFIMVGGSMWSKEKH